MDKFHSDQSLKNYRVWSTSKNGIGLSEVAQRLVRDMGVLYQRYTTELQQAPSLPRPGATLPPSHFPDLGGRKEATNYKNTRAWHELGQRMGPTIRVADVRKIADTLSRNWHIPLTADVRNHADLLR